MSTYSDNTTLKVSAAVSVSGAPASYTAPAGGYAIVHVGPTSASINVTLGGQTIVVATNSVATPFYVGPSQTISASLTGGGNAHIAGVAFVNSP